MGRGPSWSQQEAELLDGDLAAGKSAFQISKSRSWAYSTVKKAVTKRKEGLDIVARKTTYTQCRPARPSRRGCQGSLQEVHSASYSQQARELPGQKGFMEHGTQTASPTSSTSEVGQVPGPHRCESCQARFVLPGHACAHCTCSSSANEAQGSNDKVLT